VPSNINRRVVSHISPSVLLIHDHWRRLDTRRSLRLIQQAEICGLDTHTFHQAMTQLETAHERICQHFCGLSVDKWTHYPGRFGRTFSASNRLFTLKRDAPTEQSTDFQPGVDPLGELERVKSEDVFHGTENVVSYFKRSYDPSTK
jgi:hypothetical protein